MKLETVFVYGTLRTGFCNNHLLDGQICLGQAVTTECMKLCMDVDDWPMLSREPGPCPVQGEAYQVDPDCLARLDALEGHPRDYERKRSRIVLPMGLVMTAWMYFRSCDDGVLVPSGDYADHPAARLENA